MSDYPYVVPGDAIASRQPARQEPYGWVCTGPNGTLFLPLSARDVIEVNAKYMTVVPVYAAAQTSQAVDLEQFRECVELMEWQERGHANPDWPVGDPKKHAEALRLLALIDSKVVGK